MTTHGEVILPVHPYLLSSCPTKTGPTFFSPLYPFFFWPPLIQGDDGGVQVRIAAHMSRATCGRRTTGTSPWPLFPDCAIPEQPSPSTVDDDCSKGLPGGSVLGIVVGKKKIKTAPRGRGAGWRG